MISQMHFFQAFVLTLLKFVQILFAFKDVLLNILSLIYTYTCGQKDRKCALMAKCMIYHQTMEGSVTTGRAYCFGF